MLSSDIFSFVAALLILAASASLMVHTLSRIAAELRVSEFVISFIIVGFATSIPELFIGITSALEANPQLSLGNLIGANIADLTLVVGIPILLSRGQRIGTKVGRADVTPMLAIAGLPLLLMMIGNELSRIDGIILILAFVLYIYRLTGKQRKSQKDNLPSEKNIWTISSNSLLFLLSLFFVLGSAHFVVEGATSVAAGMGLPIIIVGLVMLGLGTSLPEITFNSRSVISGHPEMALGNCVGSIVVNSSLVLGIVALIHPIREALLLYLTSWIFLLFVCFVFLVFVRSSSQLTWRHAVSLLLIYIVFLIIELSIDGAV